jgi:hypothetical protein
MRDAPSHHPVLKHKYEKPALNVLKVVVALTNQSQNGNCDFILQHKAGHHGLSLLTLV